MKHGQILESLDKMIMKRWLKDAKTFDGGADEMKRIMIKSSYSVMVHLRVNGCHWCKKIALHLSYNG